MTEKVLKAVENMRGSLSCSQSVLCAFADDIEISQHDAKKIAAPYSGGKGIKCGTVCAAEIVLAKKFGEDTEKIAEFENKFLEKVGAINCRDIRGKNLRPCIGCVEDSATILEEMLA